MDRTFSGEVVLLMPTGAVAARVHACFVAHESPDRPSSWDGEIWSATGGPLRLRTGGYKVQFPNGPVGELRVTRGSFAPGPMGDTRLAVVGEGGLIPV